MVSTTKQILRSFLDRSVRDRVHLQELERRQGDPLIHYKAEIPEKDGRRVILLSTVESGAESRSRTVSVCNISFINNKGDTEYSYGTSKNEEFVLYTTAVSWEEGSNLKRAVEDWVNKHFNSRFLFLRALRG